MAVPHLSVAVPDAPGGALPYHLPAIGTNLEAVTVAPRLILIPHETEKGHVHWCHPKLEGLKVQAEVLPETMKHLLKINQTNVSRFEMYIEGYIDTKKLLYVGADLMSRYIATKVGQEKHFCYKYLPSASRWRFRLLLGWI